MKQNKHVVLIDDNQIDCFINQKIIALADPELSTTTFNSGVEALAFFKNEYEVSLDEPGMIADFILLDINMPVMNGFEFLKKLSELEAFRKNPIDVYFLSSSIHEDDIANALSHEFGKGYISKPLSKEKVRNILEGSATLVQM